VRNKFWACVRVLLKHGADPAFENQYGGETTTPYKVADGNDTRAELDRMVAEVRGAALGLSSPSPTPGAAEGGGTSAPATSPAAAPDGT
jgi:hypothetical protein